MTKTDDDKRNPWWRYTWTKDGALSTLDRVEGGRQEDGKLVGYVQAPNRQSAAALAKRLLQKEAMRRAKAAVRTKTRADELKEQGLCFRCGNVPPIDGGTACRPCMDRVAERARVIRTGGERLIAPPAKTEEEKIAARERLTLGARARRARADEFVPQAAYHRACAALRSLRLVLWKLDRAKSLDDFRRWILEAIAAEEQVVLRRNAAERGELPEQKAAS